MENLQRRPSGIYVARLTVPERLRKIVGKRELVASTGTTNLHVAKLVASTVLARWRRSLFDLQCAPARSDMHDEILLRIADGHPLLAMDSYMPISGAAALLGLDSDRLLRFAGELRLKLFFSAAGEAGFLVPADLLAVDDPELGTRLVPNPDDMPALAVRQLVQGVVGIPRSDLAAVAATLRAAGEVFVVAFDPPGAASGTLFIPDVPVRITTSTVEVSTREVDHLRAQLAARVHGTALEAAREAQRARLTASPAPVGKNAHKRVSEALELYGSKFLPQKITNPKEIQRVKAGISLFIELEGDLTLAEVDADRLRHFRDVHLTRLPARENEVRAKHKTTSVSASIRAVEGTDWPRMSAAERDQRMQWIARMLGWLRDQDWISSNPAAALRGEFATTKAERRLAALEHKPRQPFTSDELALIFGQQWFRTGSGVRTRFGTYREFQPFHYWLPLLGLYLGARINELAQLHLTDVRTTPSGTPFISINRDTPDKSLKQQKESTRCWSAREIPLHPHLVELGFVSWCDRLRAEGYRRVFPELSWTEAKYYSKEPVRWMSLMLERIGIPRDNTRVFHSFRHGVNNALSRLQCAPELRKRLLGHEPGEGVNERTYLTDPTPDESLPVVRQLTFSLPTIAAFDGEAGLAAVRDALRRKNHQRGSVEDLGPASRSQASLDPPGQMARS
jgi:integrase